MVSMVYSFLFTIVIDIATYLDKLGISSLSR